MRKLQDIRCGNCGETRIDQYVDINKLPPHGCGGAFVRVILPGTPQHVIGDDIPGGLEIKHGLCNADGTPRKYYTKSAIRQEAEKRGYENYVVHVPERGSDKSKHTSRWV